MVAVRRWLACRMRGNPYRFGPLTYTPSECKTWQARIKRLIPDKSLKNQTGKIGMWVTWFRAKTWSDSIQRLRPDSDNIQKNLLDALQGALYLDDAYVCESHIKTIFDAPVPMLRVKIRHIGTKDKLVKWCIAPEPKAKLIKTIKGKLK